ncbi:MAG: hypothetical protein J6U17_05300 [Kiritimatiellae bacterium]|nr:hypothetical protein [Kiritimatiellia bacterium]
MALQQIGNIFISREATCLSSPAFVVRAEGALMPEGRFELIPCMLVRACIKK